MSRMKLEELKKADSKDVKRINLLLKQLSESYRGRSASKIGETLGNKMTEVWVAREEGDIVGIAVLVLVQSLQTMAAHIEDVVVDESQRGKGLGTQLMDKLIERAKKRGALHIDLTSRPSRVAANALYHKLGFEQRDTNMYRLKL